MFNNKYDVDFNARTAERRRRCLPRECKYHHADVNVDDPIFCKKAKSGQHDKNKQNRVPTANYQYDLRARFDAL